MALVKIVLVHGGLKLGTGPEAKYAQRGDEVELDEKAVADLDPSTWMTPESWVSAKAQAKAQADLEAELAKAAADGKKAKPLPPKLGAAIEAEKKKLQAEAARKKTPESKPESKPDPKK